MVRSIVQALRYHEPPAGVLTEHGGGDDADGPRPLRGSRRSQLSVLPAGLAAQAGGDAAAAFFSRFVVLQSIGAAAIAALWIAGLANKPFESNSAPMCLIILLIGALGMVCVALKRWQDVQWIATHVVRIGLLGTVIGLIIAFSHAAMGAGSPDDIKPMIAAVVSGMYVSLYATLFGIGTNLWLKINLRLLGNQHG